MQKLVEMDEKMHKKGVFAINFRTTGGLFPPGSQVFGQKLIYSTPRGGGGASGQNIYRWTMYKYQKLFEINWLKSTI